MNPPIVLILLLSLLACQADDNEALITRDKSGEIHEPIAAKRPHIMEIHGDQRVDNYYWLRDDSRTDPEILAYLEHENNWTAQESRASRALHETLYDEMVGRRAPE